jgi:glycosyltransferase involved in cell wall biosynthesis
MHRREIIISNFDDTKNPIYAGGGAFAVHEVARRLGNHFEITVLTGNYPGASNEIRDGVQYRRIGVPFLAGRVGQLVYHFVLPWHALFMEYDIWVESFTPPFSTSFVPLFTKRPVIGLVHMLSASDMVRKYRLPFHWIENFGLKFYRHFIVLTKRSAEEVRLHNPSADIAVIGNGVALPELRNETRIAKRLSFIGRLEIDQKGIDILLETYKKISEKIDVPLFIAGSGSDAEVARIERIIESYGLRDSVHFLGRVENEEKEGFFRETKIGILSSRFETFSLVALEMMSYGIPVVAFDIPGLEWVPENAMIRVPSFDMDAMADAVVKLMNDEEYRARISRHARSCAEQHDWDSIASEYGRFIERVITERKTL